MDSVMIQSSFQKDVKRRSPNYRPRRKTRSVIARKRWPNWFGILILRAGQHESDRDANPRGGSWFETPAAAASVAVIGRFDGLRFMSALFVITPPCEIRHSSPRNLREIRRTGSPIRHPERQFRDPVALS